MVICGIILFIFDKDQKNNYLKHFTGTYECKADTKGRIMIPVALKKQMKKIIKEEFVIKRGVFNQCLEIYPIIQWNLMMNNINSLNRFKKKNVDFIRRFTAGVKLIELDSSGRFLIPRNLLIYADIKKEVVVSSAVNIIEIWDKRNYEKAIDSALIDFPGLAEEVMGDKNETNDIS